MNNIYPKRKKKLAVVTTHPIQYYAPVFKLLAQNIDLKIFYTWGADSIDKFDPGFGKKVEWDIPLLEGYEYEFLTNTAENPGSHHFLGIKNLDAIARIKAFQPNAILVYGWSYYTHLKIMRYFKGKVPVWFRGDSHLLDEEKGWKGIIKGLLLHWVYKKVDKAFFVGTANKAYFIKYGLNDNQLLFAPHAVDNNRFAKNRYRESAILRDRLGVKEDDIVILFAGKLEHKKDPQLLLTAFSQLESFKIHLLFVGDGVLAKSLKDQSANLSMEKKVHFLPFQNQQYMPVVYQACDLFCLPSKGPGETWGLAINEAMAAGKAILVSDKVGCAQDLVRSGENGEIFKAGNVDDMIRKLDVLCSNRHELSSYGSNSVKKIQRWSFDSQIQIICKELDKI